MHIHMPKPLHGWREFAGEVGIIVVGVLIALGAEQLIVANHWRHQVADYRQALRSEIAYDIGTHRYRIAENRCVTARIDALDRWLESWRHGHPIALSGPIGLPSSLSIYTGVWSSRNAELESHMSLDERLTYSRLYDDFANNEVHRLAERQVWTALADYDHATDLDHGDLMRLQGLITQARLRQQRFTSNAEGYFAAASKLGIEPKSAPDWEPPMPDMCQPLIAGPNATRA